MHSKDTGFESLQLQKDLPHNERPVGLLLLEDEGYNGKNVLNLSQTPHRSGRVAPTADKETGNAENSTNNGRTALTEFSVLSSQSRSIK